MARRRFKLRKGFIFQEVAEGIVIFDAEESKLYTFNETASFIFTGIKKGNTEEALIKKLVAEYQIKEEQAIEEVKSFLKHLNKLRIIE